MIVDVNTNRLRLCQVERAPNSKGKVNLKTLAIRDKLPNFYAFDWSKTNEHIVAIGTGTGDTTLLQVGGDRPQNNFTHSFSIKSQRKVNTVAFSTKNFIATGLEKVRNDYCMNIHDLNVGSLSPQQEPYKRLATGETVSSVKFFASQPDTLIAGFGGSSRPSNCIRLYDLRGTPHQSRALLD